MLFEEAQWVGKTILQHSQAGNTILNLGSSTIFARTVLQPHMEKFIFYPLREKKIEVIHSDIIDEECVDLVGDFTDPQFINSLFKKKFNMVMCCNLFEHLSDKTLLVNTLNTIVPNNEYLLLTVPYQYPYHLDPIDTLYRPTVEDLTKLFPEFNLIEGAILTAQRQVFKNGKIKFHKNYFQMLNDDSKLFTRLIIRLFFPFYKFNIWYTTARDLKNMFKPFSATCVLLKKI